MTLEQLEQMDMAEKATTVRGAVEELLRGIEGAFATLNYRLDEAGLTIDRVPDEIRPRLERIDGALSAARDYIKEQAQAIR